MSHTPREAAPEPAVETAPEAVSAAFAALGNETRLTILLALWERYDPSAPMEPVSFSALKDRVGMRDSGQFNYHLDKLEGRFVRKVEAGYVLHPIGLKLTQTVIGGATQETTVPPTPLDVACHLCGGATTVSYEEGWLYHRCTECPGGYRPEKPYPEGWLFAEPLLPAATKHRTPAELFAAGLFQLLQSMGTKLGGVCPQCSGPVEADIDACHDHDATEDEVCSTCGRFAAVGVGWTCTVCKYAGGGAVGMVLAVHPAAVAFYHERGVDIGYPMNDVERAGRVLELIRGNRERVVSTDPVRIEAVLAHGEDELRLTVDEDLRVLDIDERP